MARISFAASQQFSEPSNYRVPFFSLSNDGDEAIVRIMHDSVNDFDILTVHNVKIDGKYKKVSCLRQPTDPVDKCPFCKVGKQIQNRFFIHMLQYETTPEGKIKVTPVIWDRSAKEYGQKLSALIDEYGPLSDCIFKIRRNGVKNDMNTTYELMFGNPNIYRADLYPKDTEAFGDYNVLGTVVMDKTDAEMNTFLATGKFPEINTRKESELDVMIEDNDATTNPVVTNQPYNADGTPVINNTPTTNPSNTTSGYSYANNTQTLPWENPNPQVATPNRPNRSY